MNSILIPVRGEHAEALYPLVKDSPVTDQILWDGPESLESYQRGLGEREIQVREGLLHMFTILDPDSGVPIGSIDIRPDHLRFRADIGLWIGNARHGKGIGTRAIAEITRYGFDHLKLKKIEGNIFLGNIGSRRAFEKCGYRLEGTIRRAILKRGVATDEWVMGIIPEDLRRTV